MLPGNGPGAVDPGAPSGHSGLLPVCKVSYGIAIKKLFFAVAGFAVKNFKSP
jgi:hypothetical protein